MEFAATLSLDKAREPGDSNVMCIRSLYNLCAQEAVQKTPCSKEPALTTLTRKGALTFQRTEPDSYFASTEGKSQYHSFPRTQDN